MEGAHSVTSQHLNVTSRPDLGGVSKPWDESTLCLLNSSFDSFQIDSTGSLVAAPLYNGLCTLHLLGRASGPSMEADLTGHGELIFAPLWHCLAKGSSPSINKRMNAVLWVTMHMISHSYIPMVTNSECSHFGI